MVQLPWLYRQAMKLLRVLELSGSLECTDRAAVAGDGRLAGQLEDAGEHFKTVLKAGGIMDVVEQYPWSGEEVVHPRRDKRSGTHTGHVMRTERGPCIQVEWGEPFAGRGTDTFELSPDGSTLTQHTVMEGTVSGEQVKYKTIYYRVQ
ncbi:hypothetical protein ABPG75_009776 [Micractinium tetrahymenae]